MTIHAYDREGTDGEMFMRLRPGEVLAMPGGVIARKVYPVPWGHLTVEQIRELIDLLRVPQPPRRVLKGDLIEYVRSCVSSQPGVGGIVSLPHLPPS